jgi:RNA polymerase sigma factor (sigma-70 family)
MNNAEFPPQRVDRVRDHRLFNLIVKASTTGDSQAINDLLRMIEARLILICHSLMYDQNRRWDGYSGSFDDFTQKVRFRIFLNIQRLRSISSEEDFFRWVGAMARNIYIDGYRRERRQNKVFDENGLENYDLPVNYTQHVDNWITEWISSLPEQERLIVYLWAVEGYTYRELEDRLDISRGTVAHYLQKALKSLRKYYGSEPPYKD